MPTASARAPTWRIRRSWPQRYRKPHPLWGLPGDAIPLWQGSGTLASRVGESATGSDFTDKRGRGGKSVGGTGRRMGSCGLWGSRGRHRWPLLWPAKAPCTATPTDNCVQRRSGVCYRSGRRSLMEMAVQCGWSSESSVAVLLGRVERDQGVDMDLIARCGLTNRCASPVNDTLALWS